VVRTSLPILATLTLTAGLLLPAGGVSWVRRRGVERPAATPRVDICRGLPRLQAERPAAPLAVEMPVSESDEALAGPVVPVDPVAGSLESGWWLTPPAVAVVRGQMTRRFCASFGGGACGARPGESAVPSDAARAARPRPRFAVHRPSPPGGWERRVSPSRRGVAA